MKIGKRRNFNHRKYPKPSNSEITWYRKINGKEYFFWALISPEGKAIQIRVWLGFTIPHHFKFEVTENVSEDFEANHKP